MTTTTNDSAQHLASEIMKTLHTVLQNNETTIKSNKDLEHKIKELENENEELDEEIDKKDVSLRYCKNLTKNEAIKFMNSKAINEMTKQNYLIQVSHYKSIYTNVMAIYVGSIVLSLFDSFITYVYGDFNLTIASYKFTFLVLNIVQGLNTYNNNKLSTKQNIDKIKTVQDKISEKQKEIDDMLKSEDFLGDVIDNV